MLGLLFEQVFLRRLRHDDARLDQGVVVFLASCVDAVVVGLQIVMGFSGDAYDLRALRRLTKYFAVLHVSQKSFGLARHSARGGRREQTIGRIGGLRHDLHLVSHP